MTDAADHPGPDDDAAFRLIASLREELTAARARIEALEGQLRSRPSRPAPLPVLCRDLARWSAPPPVAPVATVRPAPPPLPPTPDDLDTVHRFLDTIRRLLRTPVRPGVPYYTAFDAGRYQALYARVREAGVLVEKLLGQVARSRTQTQETKDDGQWLISLAKRNEEVNRRRR